MLCTLFGSPDAAYFQCDEARPKCRACQRHRVSCDYIKPASKCCATPDPHSTSVRPATVSASDDEKPVLPSVVLPKGLGDDGAALEMRLLHYFLTETIATFHGPINFWHTRLPLVGLKHRFVFDSLISLAALELYRQTSSVCSPTSAVKHIEDGTKRGQGNWLPTEADHSYYLAG